jgi:hypothetical protein
VTPHREEHVSTGREGPDPRPIGLNSRPHLRRFKRRGAADEADKDKEGSGTQAGRR